MEFVSNVAAAIMRNAAAEFPFYAMLAAALAGGLLTDFVRRRSLKERYLSRYFRTDVIYCFFDLIHFWHFLILVPLTTGLIVTLSPWLRVEALASVHPAAQVAITFVFTDFCNYWYHRAQHTNKWLWQFHKVHHCQKQLSSLTTFRQSLLTRIFTAFVLAIPAAIMDAGVGYPMAVIMLILLHQALEHSNTSWSFGILGKIIVSPAYHEVHHSSAPEHLNKNLSPVLTIWDATFGTFAERGSSELKYGLRDEQLPESYLYQIFAPAHGMYRLWRARAPQRQPARTMG